MAAAGAVAVTAERTTHIGEERFAKSLDITLVYTALVKSRRRRRRGCAKNKSVVYAQRAWPTTFGAAGLPRGVGVEDCGGGRGGT